MKLYLIIIGLFVASIVINRFVAVHYCRKVQQLCFLLYEDIRKRLDNPTNLDKDTIL